MRNLEDHIGNTNTLARFVTREQPRVRFYNWVSKRWWPVMSKYLALNEGDAVLPFDQWQLTVWFLPQMQMKNWTTCFLQHTNVQTVTCKIDMKLRNPRKSADKRCTLYFVQTFEGTKRSLIGQISTWQMPQNLSNRMEKLSPFSWSSHRWPF